MRTRKYHPLALVFMGLLLCLSFGLAGCSDPKNLQLPEKLEDIEKIKPQLQKLSEEDRALLGTYLVRRALKNSPLGGMAGDTGSDKNMTVGQAIENQRAFVAAAAKREQEEKALAAKLKTEQEAALAVLREAATVTLISKKLDVERGPMSGMEMGKELQISVGYKNNGSKDITTIKGTLQFVDLTGEEITRLQIDNTNTIKAGGTAVWNGKKSLTFSFHKGLQTLAELADDKYKVVWLPDAIAFADGTVMKLPADK